jgi:hypothetical protein
MGEMKKCSKCPDEAQVNHKYCRKCQRDYDRRRYITNKAVRQEQIRLHRIAVRKWMDEIKESHPCSDCHQFFPAVVMEWDHPNPTTKTANVSDLVKSGLKGQAEREIEQCELVCANHHRIRHIDRA